MASTRNATPSETRYLVTWSGIVSGVRKYTDSSAANAPPYARTESEIFLSVYTTVKLNLWRDIVIVATTAIATSSSGTFERDAVAKSIATVPASMSAKNE